MSKLRVFESFSGIGSMSMALRNLGIDFELVGTSEVDRYAILAYDAIHGDNEDIDVPSKEEMLRGFNICTDIDTIYRYCNLSAPFETIIKINTWISRYL